MTELGIEELRAQLAAREVVVFVGAGISAQATGNAPTARWKGLLESGLRHCEAFGDPQLQQPHAELFRQLLEPAAGGSPPVVALVNTYLSVGQIVESTLKAPSGKEWKRWLDGAIGGLKVTDPTIVHAVQSLNAPIVTTNYDRILLEAGRERYEPITWMDESDWVDVLTGSRRGILYLHGFYGRPETVVLGASSYERLVAHEVTQSIERTLGLAKTLLFIGFGGAIGDPNIGPLLDWLASSRHANRRHYILLKREDADGFGKRSNVHPISYGATDDFLSAFLEDLPSSRRARGRLRVATDSVDVLADRATFTESDHIPIPEMVIVPAGEFAMGSDTHNSEPLPEEQPAHGVHIDYRFAVSVHPVTFEDWDAFEDNAGGHLLRPNDAGWGRGKHPVIHVSWHQVHEYLKWLNDLDSVEGTYRLLTEAEWEYVARANTTTRFWWGSAISPSNANFDDAGLGRTTPVAEYAANPFGVRDILGNVWEWVQDRYHAGYGGAPTDGSSWEDGDDVRRVVRGGCWYYGARYLEPTARLPIEPSVRFNSIGFRIARTVRQPLDVGKVYALVSVISGLAASVEIDGAIAQRPWAGNAGQLWEMREGDEGLIIAAHGESRVMTVDEPRQRNYARIRLAEFDGDTSQQWRAEPEGDGYVFLNLGSGKVLDVEGISTESGAAIIQFARHGNSNQRWWSRSVRPT